MATLLVTPVAEKLPQLRTVLNGRFGQKVSLYVVHPDGTLTLHGVMPGILRDIARVLAREGLVVN